VSGYGIWARQQVRRVPKSVVGTKIGVKSAVLSVGSKRTRNEGEMSEGTLEVVRRELGWLQDEVARGERGVGSGIRRAGTEF
jgi:hypothetical protein